MGTSILTSKRLRELLSYDGDTGLFTRIKFVSGRYGSIGRVCGTIDSHGYVSVTIDKKKHAAHRLAWFYTHGNWPKFEIDHINGSQTDNRIANLRDVQRFVNHQNRRVARQDSRVGLLGVTISRKKFRAVLSVSGKAMSLGSYETADAAHDAYVKAKRKFHPGCCI